MGDQPSKSTIQHNTSGKGEEINIVNSLQEEIKSMTVKSQSSQ